SMASASAFRKAVASLALLALFALPAAGFCQSCAAPPARPASAQFHANHCASMAHSSRAGAALRPQDCGQKPAACSLAATLRGKPALNLSSGISPIAVRSERAETSVSKDSTAATAYAIAAAPPQHLALRI